ncbi:hypothetical protein PROFUN_03170 [Planoprotostelium fungivorum]|uniref:Uncharacterized protein n=1 Tax=Planoprotostelium fungivorum TaxID=1890364 RepID=A0A2P6NWW6_9EUKA|nr:hypothetical protein PROFUN_03170 [Planoprotostelium fungivorum]
MLHFMKRTLLPPSEKMAIPINFAVLHLRTDGAFESYFLKVYTPLAPSEYLYFDHPEFKGIYRSSGVVESNIMPTQIAPSVQNISRRTIYNMTPQVPVSLENRKKILTQMYRWEIEIGVHAIEAYLFLETPLKSLLPKKDETCFYYTYNYGYYDSHEHITIELEQPLKLQPRRRSDLIPTWTVHLNTASILEAFYEKNLSSREHSPGAISTVRKNMRAVLIESNRCRLLRDK